MNLEQHITVLWRYRTLVVSGLLLGLLLAFLAAFQVKTSGLERRGEEKWSSQSRVLVTQAGFPWGRAVFPNQQNTPGQAPAQPQTGEEGEDDIQFADPTRFSTLAALYSVISNSDQVRRLVPGNPEPGQIQAVPVPLAGEGSDFLPVVEITTTAESEAEVLALNRRAVAALDRLLVREQRAAEIPVKQRIRIEELNKPSEPELEQGRAVTPSILAFLLCLVGTLAFVHILEQLRQRGWSWYGSGLPDPLERPLPDPAGGPGNGAAAMSMSTPSVPAQPNGAAAAAPAATKARSAAKAREAAPSRAEGKRAKRRANGASPQDAPATASQDPPAEGAPVAEQMPADRVPVGVAAQEHTSRPRSAATADQLAERPKDRRTDASPAAGSREHSPQRTPRQP